MAEPLEEHFAQLLTSVPIGPVGEADFVFDRGTIARPPRVLATSNVFGRPGTHSYSDSAWLDSIDLVLGRTTARAIACVVIGTLLHGGSSEIELQNPSTVLKRIIVKFDHPSERHPPVGLSVLPNAVRYFPGEAKRNPWDRAGVIERDLPWFEFTIENGPCVTQDQRALRDTLLVGGRRAAGLAAFGELLLDAGRPDARESEFNLEAISNGVAFNSAEVNLWLPGSLMWQHLPKEVALAAN
ncbi:MAG: hypothetical protein ACQGVK_11625 [Myxococcota bacterium]